MRDLRVLERYRAKSLEMELYGTTGGEGEGVFVIFSPVDKAHMAVVASSGEGWDHVSVSRKNRPPNWREMDYARRLFFKDEETVMQLHVPLTDHVNVAETCLHLWRPQNVEIPRPPDWMVGPKKNPFLRA